MKMRTRQALETSEKSSDRLVAIAPSSDFVLADNPIPQPWITLFVQIYFTLLRYGVHNLPT